MNPYVEIARPWQWYKNLVAFLGIFFAGLFLNIHALLFVIITFFALSLASSGVYVINDILAYSVNALVFLAVSALILNTLVYSLFFKRFAFVDIADLALNFLFRTLAGVFAIGVYPWHHPRPLHALHI